MLALALAILSPTTVATNPSPPIVFSPEERVALSNEVKRSCGFASPQELMERPEGERQKALPCLLEATIRRSESMLPKVIEPGVVLISSELFQGGLPVFVLRFSPEHPRALNPKNEASPYDDLLSTRTCNDKWLGGIIDAGVVGDQSGSVIVYKLETEKGEVFDAIAVARCFNPK